MNLTSIVAEHVSSNLIAVSALAFNTLGTDAVIDGQEYAYYRRGKDPDNNELAFYRLKDVPPSSFAPEDNEVLNSYCEGDEGKKNKAVKRTLSAALSTHFNKQAFHVYEFGAGFHPISEYFDKKARLSYHGIDVDEKCITELHRMNVPASDWNAAMSTPVPDDKPSVAVSVYAMHFMVDKDFADKIDHLTSAGDGFFVGNFYIDPEEKITRAGRTALENILFERDLYHIAFKNPKENSNEYWIIGKADSVATMQGFAENMQRTVARNWSRKLEKTSQSSTL